VSLKVIPLLKAFLSPIFYLVFVAHYAVPLHLQSFFCIYNYVVVSLCQVSCVQWNVVVCITLVAENIEWT